VFQSLVGKKEEEERRRLDRVWDKVNKKKGKRWNLDRGCYHFSISKNNGQRYDI